MNNGKKNKTAYHISKVTSQLRQTIIISTTKTKLTTENKYLLQKAITVMIPKFQKFTRCSF